MFDVLKTLSALVREEKETVKIKKPKVKKEFKNAVSPKDTLSKVDTQEVLVDAKRKAEAQLHIAEAKAKEIILEAKNEAYKLSQNTQEDVRKKLEQIERREGALEEREKYIREKQEETEKKFQSIEKITAQELEKLEKVAHLTQDEAKQTILSQIKLKLKEEIAKEIKIAEAKAHDEAEDKAREILVEAMKHGATDYVAEYTVSVIKVADEDVKGRIIGKEGRNIRAFETATGVDVDLDEEGVVRLSSFDSIRREVAKVSLERLLRDGRIQPGRIEDMVKQVEKEIERIMFEEGQKMCHGVGVYNLPAPMVATLGKFKYRFSYGQNMISHTLEETKIGIALAKEVGADVNVVRLGCLLHDVGKVITDKEGSHIELGVELLKKYNMPQKVIDCVAQHHEDTPFTSIESVLVYVADAISGGRPGARYEDYEEYVKRLSDLEEIASSHKGVKEAFAFQAGRELRVIVNPEEVNDAKITIMARDIKEEVEKKMTYPGQVKVTVVRELRASEIAK